MRRTAGVVPELASRDHIAKLAADGRRRACRKRRSGLRDLDAIAYTAGPGLIGALMVGGSLASSLAYAPRRFPRSPCITSKGHLLACMLEEPRARISRSSRCSCRAATRSLIEVAGVGRYRIIGETLDDAAGEAFDKVARLLGLPYPGGPELAALADSGDRASALRCRGRSGIKAST